MIVQGWCSHCNTDNFAHVDGAEFSKHEAGAIVCASCGRLVMPCDDCSGVSGLLGEPAGCSGGGTCPYGREGVKVVQGSERLPDAGT